MSRFLLLMLAVAMLVGCASEPSVRYRNANDDVIGRADRMEYPQKSRAVTEMIEKLITDPDFKNIYSIATERAEKRGHKRPTVIVHSIADITGPGSYSTKSAGQIERELKTALRKTQLFTVIDLAEANKMIGTMLDDAQNGVKGDNNESYGEYESGDFMMFGELTKEEAAGRANFVFLNLRMVDPVTRGEIWSDTKLVSKE